MGIGVYLHGNAYFTEGNCWPVMGGYPGCQLQNLDGIFPAKFGSRFREFLGFSELSHEKKGPWLF